MSYRADFGGAPPAFTFALTPRLLASRALAAPMLAACLVAACGSPKPAPAAAPSIHDTLAGGTCKAAPSAAASTSAPAASIAETDGIPISIPHSSTALSTKYVSVSIDAAGALYIDGRRIADEAALGAEIRALAAREPGISATVAAHENVAYGRIIRVLDIVKRNGILKLSLGVTR